jgi:hypoxanthine phosphoribosyltransferase
VAKGGVFVGAAVASALWVEFFPVRISRRSRDHGKRRDAPRIAGSMPRELAGLRVLVVDDVAASGATLRLAKRLALEAGAKRVRTASLAVRKGGFKPDFGAITTDDLMVFPWDYEEIVLP